MKTKTVAVFYATKGGMGDVGKFAIALAREQQQLVDTSIPTCNVRAIALSFDEGNDDNSHNNAIDTTTIDTVDVEDSELKVNTETVLSSMRNAGDILTIHVSNSNNNESAEAQIGDALEGVDAVITCLGNRQPSMERWCSLGTRTVINAMKVNNNNNNNNNNVNNNVKTSRPKRLVSLSSMGIGTDDFLTTTPLTCLWAVLLRTLLRSARKDLMDLETTVRESGLDYAIVRPVGLTPSEPPQGSCDHLLSRATSTTSSGKNKQPTLKFMLAKSDAAAFMLKEALTPTIHEREVTIGYLTSRPTATTSSS